MAPPGVLLPGPFNTTRCRIALATYSARIRAAASVRERTRTGRLWFTREPHRLYRLSAVHLRLTHSSPQSSQRAQRVIFFMPSLIRVTLKFIDIHHHMSIIEALNDSFFCPLSRKKNIHCFCVLCELCGELLRFWTALSVAPLRQRTHCTPYSGRLLLALPKTLSESLW